MTEKNQSLNQTSKKSKNSNDVKKESKGFKYFLITINSICFALWIYGFTYIMPKALNVIKSPKTVSTLDFIIFYGSVLLCLIWLLLTITIIYNFFGLTNIKKWIDEFLSEKQADVKAKIKEKVHEENMATPMDESYDPNGYNYYDYYYQQQVNNQLIQQSYGDWYSNYDSTNCYQKPVRQQQKQTTYTSIQRRPITYPKSPVVVQNRIQKPTYSASAANSASSASVANAKAQAFQRYKNQQQLKTRISANHSYPMVRNQRVIRASNVALKN